MTIATTTPRATWIDLSVAVRPGMVTFEGNPTVTLERTASLAAGDVCNVSRLDFGVHSGPTSMRPSTSSTEHPG